MKEFYQISIKGRLLFFLLISSSLLFCRTGAAQVVILQQGFDSTSGLHSDGTWANVDQIKNGGNTWTSYGSGNDVIEGNYSCSGWTTCNDKTGNSYGITGGAPNFKGTGTNIGYTGTNSTYFAIFDDYDATDGSYGGIYTPTFNISTYTNATLTFYWNNANTSTSYIQVQYYNGSTWTYTNFGEGTGSLGWHEATMLLPSNATQIVFFIIADELPYPYAIGLDQIEIYATPPCTKPSVTISSYTNVKCNGSSTGSATVSVSGGTSPYTYSWAPGGGTNATASNLAAGNYTVTVTAGGCNNTATVTITQPSSALGISIESNSNGTCTGGNATVTANGGASPYTYLWTPGGYTTASVSNLIAGTYTATITDHNGCTVSITTTISDPPSPTATVSSSTNVSCNGGSNGSATVTASGGTTPYTYSWSGGGTNSTKTGLTAGTYTVTVTSHNTCTAVATVTITQPPVLSVSANTTSNILCYGGSNGSVSATPLGGTPPYTYSWSGGGANATKTGLTAGIYTVTLTDNHGCTATASTTITQPTILALGAIPTFNVSCYGGNNGLIHTNYMGGTEPYTFSWTGTGPYTGMNVSAGTYTITLTDAHGCTATASVTITEPTLLTVLTSVINVSCNVGSSGSASAIPSGGTSPYTYSWTGGGTNANNTGLASGTYSVTVTDNNGCTATASATITQSPALSVTATAPSSVICYGYSDVLAATVSGGTLPYTYNWSPATSLTCSNCQSPVAAPTVSTIYTVTVTDNNGCTNTATVNVTVDPKITLASSISDPRVCEGTPVYFTISPSGGTAPYTYSWTPTTGLSCTTCPNPIATPTVSTTYTATVTDNKGCTAMNVFHVTIFPTPVFNASANLESYVLGDSLSATGGVPPYTYSVNPNITSLTLPTTKTTYTMTVTGANGCSSSDTITYSPSLNNAGACGSIFISEYIQDTVDHDDGIELYNPTVNPINLSGYYLASTINGSLYTPPLLITLHGTIAAHKTFLIANTYADTALRNKAKMLSDSLSFDGSDIVALAHITTAPSGAIFTVLDEIGSDSIPPTSNGWTVGTGSTKNHTLVRQASITQGSINWVTGQNQWNVYAQGIDTSIGRYNNVCTPADAQLYLSLGDDSVTCGNPSYFNFDVLVSADSAKILNDGLFIIVFPTDEFAGDNLSDGSVQITLGPNFQYDSLKNDYKPRYTQNSSSLDVTIGNYSGVSEQGTVVDSIPQVLFHFRLKIQNSCQTGIVAFDYPYTWEYVQEDSKLLYKDSTVVDSMCCPNYKCAYQCDSFPCNKHCCNFDMDSNCIDSCYDICYNTCYDTCYQTIRVVHYYNVYTYSNYSNVGYSNVTNVNTIPTSSCSDLHIDAITKPINAGTNKQSDPANSSILTITGTGFGNEKGLIFIPDANRGGARNLILDTTDMLLWSENKIVVRMPSVMLTEDTMTPGSGLIQVVSACAMSGSNVQPLTINYSIINVGLSDEKLRCNIAMVNNKNSLVFRCDTSISNHPLIYAVVQQAVATWNCLTGVNWKLGNDTTGDTSPKLDGVSSIYFTNTLPGNAIMDTYTNLDPACKNAGDSMIYTYDADIAIRQIPQANYTWNYNISDTIFPGKYYYFYDVLLHELGHAQLLNHVDDPTSLMYWQASVTKRKNIESGAAPGPQTIYGAFDVVNTSAANTPPCSSYGILKPSPRNCVDSTLNIPSISENEYNLTLYPNPINNGSITISYELTEDSYIQFKIIDYTGREIIVLSNEHKLPGSYKEQINTDAFASGVYLFVANINGNLKTIKFIKL